MLCDVKNQLRNPIFTLKKHSKHQKRSLHPAHVALEFHLNK